MPGIFKGFLFILFFHRANFRELRFYNLYMILNRIANSFFIAQKCLIMYISYMPSKKPKMLFVIEQDLIDRIDDYRFANRINSRSEAVRRLLEEGLESAKFKTKKK